MGNGATAAIPRESTDQESTAVTSAELSQGLMLVRASTMKIIRLQLAMERRDRRLALQTVDDLVALDGKIRDFLSEIPTVATSLAPMQGELEEQRSWLAREKLTLAAGIRKSRAAPGTVGWFEPTSSADDDKPAEQAAPVAHHVEPFSSYPVADIEEEGAPARRMSLMLLAGILLLVIAVASTCFVFGLGWENFVTRISLPLGAS